MSTMFQDFLRSYKVEAAMVRFDPGTHQATLVMYDDKGVPTRCFKFYGTTTTPFTIEMKTTDEYDLQSTSWYDWEKKYLLPTNRHFELTGNAVMLTDPPPELFIDTNVQTLLRAANAYKEKLQSLQNSADRRKANLQRALVQIKNMLGPDSVTCRTNNCDGCQAEIAEALRITKEALDER